MNENNVKFGAVPAYARSSRSVNTDEHLEKKTLLLTFLCLSGARHKTTPIFGALATLFVVGVSMLLFYGCKKDGDNLVKQHKVYFTEELGDFEKYTPDGTTLHEKLLYLTNCVNEPSTYTLPNTELKEAVRFLETFFNIGVCEKQKYFVEYSHSRKTYLIDVPVHEWTDEAIILNGEALQAEYRNLISQIVTEICPEYSLNFGDVYVHELSNERVTLGITIVYGTKGEHKFNQNGRYKLLRPNWAVSVYPNGAPPLRTYEMWEFNNHSSSDPR